MFSQKQLREYQYWFDNDFANVVTRPTPPMDTVQIIDNIHAGTLRYGMHVYHFRCKDNAGLWSQVYSQFFLFNTPVPVTASYQKHIVINQYWIDNDFDHRITQNITGQDSIIFINSFNTDSLSRGIHFFHYRCQDNAGLWSPVVSQLFLKHLDATHVPFYVTNQKQIVTNQLWIDSDFNNRITLEISGQDSITFFNAFNTDSLVYGVHVFHYRCKDNSGLWSSVVSQLFLKNRYTTPSSYFAPHQKQIVTNQYWFDTNFSNRITINISGLDSIQFITLLNNDSLTTGMHVFHFRCKDNAGLWSSVCSQEFLKNPGYVSIPTLLNNKITKYRYWFDQEESFTYKNVPQADSIVVTQLDLSNVLNGLHILHTQFKDKRGLWNEPTSDSVNVHQIPGPAGPISGPIEVNEYTYGVQYTVQPIFNATSYIWTFPNGVVGTSDSNYIFLDFPLHANSGLIKVKGHNEYGNGAEASLGVTVKSLIVSPITITCSSYSICQDSALTFTATLIDGVTNPTYQWFVNGVHEGTNSNTFTYIPTNTDNIMCILTSPDLPGADTSNYISISVFPKPGPISAVAGITGLSNVCQGQNYVTYTIPLIPNANSYLWTLPYGASGASTTNIITVNYSNNALSGNITVKGINNCGESDELTLAVTVNPLPADAGIITGLSNVCQGLNAITYIVDSIRNATTYIWTLPSGASGVSTTNSITVTYSNTALSGNITVKGDNNCGEGAESTLFVTVNPLPVAAGAITGSTAVCQSQNSVTYTVPPIANATNYIWTLPSGATGSSSTNSITVDFTLAVSGNITVTGQNSCGVGTAAILPITVNPMLTASVSISSASNTICQDSAVTFNATPVNGGDNPVFRWYVNNVLVSQDSSLNNGLVTYYPFNGNAHDEGLNGNNGAIYGASLTTDRFGNPNSAYLFNGIDNYIKASSNNLPTADRTVSLWFNTNPLQSYQLSGPIAYGGTWCGYTWFEGMNANTILQDVHCGANTFSVPYTISSGQWYNLVITNDISGRKMFLNGTLIGTNSNYINNTYTLYRDLSIGVIVSGNGYAPYTDGNIGWFNGKIDDIRIYNRSLSSTEVLTLYNGSSFTYIPRNGDNIKCIMTSSASCVLNNNDTSNVITMTVHPKPVAAGAISGLTTVCQGQYGVTYTVDPIENATSYIWTLPSGANGISFTNSITVNYSNVAISGNITVKGHNYCGDGAETTLSITVNPLPESAGIITGASAVCAFSNNVNYSVGSIPNATSYIWNLPWGASGVSSTNTIDVNYTVPGSGNITVQGSNACGVGTIASLPIQINPVLSAYVNITSSVTSICQDSTVTFTATPINGGSNPTYHWYVNGILIDSSSEINNGLIASYPFNGNANDVSGNSHDGTIFGSPTLTTDRFGNPNSAYYFNGAGDYIDLGPWFTYNKFSLSFWVNEAGFTGDYTDIIDNNHTGYQNWVIQSTPNSLDYGFGVANVGGAGFTLTFNHWHHVTCIKDSLSVSTYLDGVLQNTVVASNYAPNYNNQHLYIARWGGGGRVFNGKIDDIQMYNRALSSYEVSKLYNGSSFNYFPRNNDHVQCVMTSNLPCVLNNPATSNVITMTVRPKPEATGVIQGLSTVCQGQDSVIYTLTPFNNADELLGTVPINTVAAFTSSSPLITLMIGYLNNAVSGNITITGKNACGTAEVTLPITVNPLPNTPGAIDGPLNVCQGETSVTYTVAPIANATSYVWASNTGAIGTSTTNSITLDFTSAISGNISVKGINACGDGDSSFLNIIVNSPSINATAIGGSGAATNICYGNSTTLSVLGGTLGTGASWHWYIGSCGGTLISTDPSVTVSPLVTTTYYVRAENACNNTSCLSFTVHVNSYSDAPTGVAGVSNYCYDPDNTTSLSVIGGTLGTGADWRWYENSCNGAIVGSGPSITINPSTTTTYFVNAVGTCSTTSCALLTVNVSTQSIAPVAITGTVSNCTGSSSTLSVSGGTLGEGATWVWYADVCGGTPIGHGTSIDIVAVPGRTYYVRAEGYCDTTLCASRTITEQINLLPTLSYTNNTGFVGHLVSPSDGIPTNTYRFEVRYTNADGILPATFNPRLQLDFEGNGIYTNPNDRLFYMLEVDHNDSIVTDGKDYYYVVNSLPESQNWNTLITVVDKAGCSATIGPINEPKVLTAADISIFANDITFSNAHPDPGDFITVYATIHNYSGRPADNFVVHLVNQFDTTSVFGDITIPHLGAYSSTTVSWNIQTPAVPAWCPMQVFIDWTNVLIEPNELDNQAIRPFTNGNYILPGKIVITAHPNPAIAPQNSYIDICGSAWYTGTAVHLNDSSCAGATVTYTVVETGQTGSTYTNSLGNYCVSVYAPYPAGIYHVNFHITDFTLNGDTTTSFEIYAPPPVYIYCPDLFVSINLGPQTVNPSSCHGNNCINILQGDQLSGSITVYNSGNIASGPSTLHIDAPYGSPAPPSNISIPGLSPGSSYTVPISNITYNTIGGTYFSAIADYNNNVAECNELNNSSSVCIMVHQALPDIIASGYMYSTNNECQFNSITLNLDNAGGVATGAFHNRLYIYKEGVLLTTLYNSISNIPALTCINVTFDWASPHVPGNYTFQFTADYLNEVIEISKANNNATLATTLLQCKADLSVYNCTNLKVNPADPSYPGSITLSAIIVNYGLVSAGGFYVNFDINGTNHLYFFAGSLAPGQSQTIFMTVPTPAFGNNLLTVTVDPTNLIVESNKTNNVATASLCWDFYLSDFCWGGAFWDYTQIKNQPVILNVGVNNSGLYQASNLKIKFEVSGPGLIGWVNLGDATTFCGSTACLCPFSANLPTPFAFPQAGTYYVRMTADPYNNYIECDETNNVLTVTVHVTDLPDYRVLSQYIAPSKLNPELNEPIAIDATYENIGMSGSDSLNLYTQVDNTPLDTIRVPGLLSGTFNTVHVKHSWSSNVRGIHIIRTFIDYNHEIAESNELNNEATRAVIVGKAPNLLFTYFDVNDSTPNTGDTIKIYATIKDVGYDSCNATYSLYYLDIDSNKIFIGQHYISLDTSQSVSIMTPWVVTDPKTTLIGLITNGVPAEYDLTDNEASKKIGGSIGLTFVTTPVSCHGLSDGKAKVIIGGGIEPYTISWSNGQNVDSITASAGLYTVTVSDINGLTATASVSITQPPEVHVNFNISASANPVCPNTMVTFTANAENGGTHPHYYWSLNNLSAGSDSIKFTYLPNDGDSIYCLLYYNVACINDHYKLSNVIVESVVKVPGTAGDLSGPATVCQGENNVTYQVTPIANATIYHWELLNGAIATTSSNSINVNIPINAIAGIIRVRGENSCGVGSFAQESITVNNLPNALGGISGLASVCQGQENVTYTVPPVGNATSYNWSLPGGASGASSTNSIDVTFAPDAYSGNIIVSGHNACGNGVSSSFFVNVNLLPYSAGAIATNTSISGNQIIITYSVAPINNATSYIWTMPNGSIGASTTNSISITFDTTATSGYLYVRGHNNCGNGQSSILYVNYSAPKLLKITAMFQEYYSPITGLMRPTKEINWDTGDLFNKFGDTIVDTLRIIIRKTNATSYNSPCTVDTTFYGLKIDLSGKITPVLIPVDMTGYRYIVIKHRNSIETWSDSVNFATDTIRYDFYNYVSQFAIDGGMFINNNKAYIWGGDVNQNGNLESEDGTLIYVAANSQDPTVNNGYVICDIDGNGNIDSQDYGLQFNNANLGANIINPFSYIDKKKK